MNQKYPTGGFYGRTKAVEKKAATSAAEHAKTEKKTGSKMAKKKQPADIRVLREPSSVGHYLAARAVQLEMELQ